MPTILVVEDNPQNMLLASEVLQSQGHSVLEAVNAGDGIRMAKEMQPDLIVLDMQLPGIQGNMAARLLKSDPITKNIKILALTAKAMVGDREKILKYGVDQYLSKPYAYQDLLKMVQQLLKESKKSYKP